MAALDINIIEQTYQRLAERMDAMRGLFKRPLTLTEKILASHLEELPGRAPERRKTYVNLLPDRVAMQDATAQMALLQFMQAGRKTSAVPATIHCDHLICAEKGARPDLDKALKDNAEVYAFLQSVARKYGMGFWKPGAGIIHQIVFENYAFPGGLMIGTDSHTPNAGGLGMIAVGVGGADAVDVMAGMTWELKWPSITGIRLSGALSGWASPKDVILYLLGKLTVKGGTGKVLEYFGEGCATLSCTGKATITNMGAELGATASLFPLDMRMCDFLEATGRSDAAALAAMNLMHLTPDMEVLAAPENYYDEIIDIDLSALEPQLAGPHTPDLVRPLSAMKADARKNGYPEEMSAGLVGSCTNSSYEDIGRAASVAEQAIAKGLKAKSLFFITPGSEQVYETVKRDGFLGKLEAIGGVVLTNGCGQCIGQWNRTDAAKERKNAITTTFNRNFAQRNDGSPNTQAFISSPEIVTAMAITGKLTFDPAHDTVENGRGGAFRLEPPAADDLPKDGFVQAVEGLVRSTGGDGAVQVNVASDSKRLQLLAPFSAWDGRDIENLRVLIKVKGKCTTDHISPAGTWLKFRGHLDNISNNMLLGATNAFPQEPGKTIPELARELKAKGVGWIVVGDENYGEGSSREHAAMSPRFLGARAIVARSFARIHETNLKKQGILPLTFADPADYDKILADDSISIIGLQDLTPASKLSLKAVHANQSTEIIEVRHTLSAMQIEWFKFGSALNLIAAKGGRT